MTRPKPTTAERYQHFRKNAEAFVNSMEVMVAALERGGKKKQATNLKVWCLMPWQAAIHDDDSGDLWFICEVCQKPIKDENEFVSSGDCYLHRLCCAPVGHAAAAE